MKINNRYVTAALICLTLVFPYLSAAASGPPFHARFTGLTGTVEFDGSDSSGCVETFVLIQAVDARVILTGHHEVNSSILVTITQFDNCTLTQLLLAGASAALPDNAFQIDKQLRSAALNATIQIFDSVSNTSFPLELSLSWIGAGQPLNQKSHFVLRAPGFRSSSTFAGSFRPATASGSAIAGTTDFFSSSPLVFAELDSVKTGELDFVH